MINQYHLEGILAYDKQEYENARNKFLQALESNPNHADSYFFLGQSHFMCAETQQAFECLETFIKLKQHSKADKLNVSMAFVTIAQCYESVGKDSLAINYYLEATKLDESNVAVLHNLGLLYLKSAEYYLKANLKDSIKLFDNAKLFLLKALNNVGNNPVFLQSIASWYEKYTKALTRIIIDKKSAQEEITGHFELAIAYYEQAIAACGHGQNNLPLKNIIINNNISGCFTDYGHHLYDNKNFQKAQTFYLKALKLDPEDTSAINQMGMCYYMQEAYTKAREYFEECLDLAQEPEERADALLNIACTFRGEKEWALAEKSLAQAKLLAPLDEYILAEEATLMESKLQALHISSPLKFFEKNNVVSQDIENGKNQENSEQFTLK